MGLTDEQKAIRETGIGASETPAILELSPYQNPVDVWLRKTGRAQAQHETDEQWLGSALEPALRGLYTERTGRAVRPVGHTFRHAVHPHVLASPDGLAEDGGVELKAVSSRMAHHWEGGTVPDYVDVQCRQNMAVLDREWWDVVALIDSTTLLIQRVHREREVEAAMCEAVEAFWVTHVEQDIPPDAATPEQVRQSLRARYPFRAREKEPRVDDSEHVAMAARWLESLSRERRRLEQLEDELTNAFCEYVGPDYGVKGGWGSFLWYPRQGFVSWQKVAEEIAGGAVPAEIIEKHRGSASRVPKLYPFKRKESKR